MRNFKRILTIGLTALMLLAMLSVSAFAAQTKFTDVNAKDETLTQAVSLLEGIGVTKGTSETTFGTNEPVTRQQMAAFIYRLMKSGKSLEGGENTTPFTDLYDDTFYGMVSWANSMGIIKGISATEFDPDGSIILQDAYTMIVRALGYEKESALAYPFDYINIAEKTGVELSEGLPSGVSYEKELTRGNVAVLLYNAFYAETGVAEVKEVERLIGTGDNKKYVLETKEYYPTLCEKYYDVIEETFIVRETTHYAFNDSIDSTVYKPNKDSNGENSMMLVAAEEGQKVASFYTTVAELGLTGTADDYIMSGLKVFYTYDEDDKKVENVLLAENMMQKLSADKATYGSYSNKEKTAENVDYYYESALAADEKTRIPTDYVKMDGSLTVSGKTMYFYDAPYSYLKPQYAAGLTDAEKYEERNADNAKLIGLTCLDTEDELYSYYITDDVFGSKDEGNEFVKKFYLLRTGGIYKVDIFDPDGDGRFEYMWYKPATIGKIVMDDDYDFADYDEYKENTPYLEDVEKVAVNGSSVTPVIYANGAKLSGKAFNDGDFVAAYLNGDANTIDIYGVATGKKGYITDVRVSTATMKLGNQTVTTAYANKFFDNFWAHPNTGNWWKISHDGSTFKNNANKAGNLLSTDNFGKEAIFYVYNHSGSHVIYYELLSGGASAYAGENILIPIGEETISKFNSKTGKTAQYLEVWVDGAIKYVPVDIDECYPAPQLTVDGTYLFMFDDNELVDEVNGKSYQPYYNKICTYSTDKNGVYTIHSVLHATNEDGDSDHIDLVIDEDDFFDEKTVNQAANDLGFLGGNELVTFKKVSGSRYALLNEAGDTMLGSYGETASEQVWVDYAYLTDTTTVILRSTTEEKGELEYEYHVYNGKSFPGTLDSELSNVQYIYENSEDRTDRVNLVLLYGEVDGDVEFDNKTSKSDWRIVKSVDTVPNEDGTYSYAYELFNPGTGKVDENVLGTKTATKASALPDPQEVGAVINLTTDGLVADGKEPLFIFDAEANTNLAFVDEVILDENTLSLIPVNEEDEAYFTDEDGVLHTYFEIADDVAVSMIKMSEINNFVTAEFSVLTPEQFEAGKNDIKSYNEKVTDDKNPDKYLKKYANYVKVYVTYTTSSKSDAPIVDSILVVVNPDEPEEYLDIK